MFHCVLVCVPGADIHLVQSYNYNARLVANNSFILHHPDNCSSQCFTDIYCYSNSSLMGNGSVILPNGMVYSSNSTPYTNFSVEILHSAIHLVVPNTLQRNTRLNEGIFTFVIPDSNGNMLQLSLGLYTYAYYQGIQNSLIIKFSVILRVYMQVLQLYMVIQITVDLLI